MPSLEQVANPALGFVYPFLQMDCGRHVSVPFAKSVSLAQESCELEIVTEQLVQHLRRAQARYAIVSEPVQAANLPKGVHRGLSNSPDAFRETLDRTLSLRLHLAEQLTMSDQVESGGVPPSTLGLY
jgi:hypothetical protein